jgi:uncharacterized protein YndB with AHSA1/START domain
VAKSAVETPVATKELVISKVFDASPDILWTAWTSPEMIRCWWGPKMFTAPYASIDLKVGGKYLLDMRGPDGKDYWSTGTYKEIVPMKKLVLADSFADAKGNIVPASYYGMKGNFPMASEITITFEKLNGKTRMTARYPSFPADSYDGAKEGWSQQFEKLEEMLKPSKTNIVIEPGSNEVVITRIFDAPREKVWKNLTDPKAIPTWWGPRELTTTIDKMEVKPGGMWRFIQADKTGNKYAFHGYYHQAQAPEKLVCTFEYEGMPGHVSMETVTLSDAAGKTLMTDKTVFQSVEDRDGMVAAGMPKGAMESNDRFAELVEKK